MSDVPRDYRRLKPGEEIRATDEYSSSVGTWQPCTKVVNGNDVIFIRREDAA